MMLVKLSSEITKIINIIYGWNLSFLFNSHVSGKMLIHNIRWDRLSSEKPR